MTALLDLFCGAGGAAMGYSQAGWEVMGIDIKRQGHYPFIYCEMDVMELLKTHKEWIRAHFDVIHASPPCQNYSVLKALHKDIDHPDLVTDVRTALQQIGLPYIIENVAGAPLINPIRLCGTMFNLRLFRHRYFEIGQKGNTIHIEQPEHTSHRKLGLKAPRTSREPVYADGEVHSIYGHFSGVQGAREAMGIDWMNRDEMAQAIPPAYTRYIAGRINRTW